LSIPVGCLAALFGDVAAFFDRLLRATVEPSASHSSTACRTVPIAKGRLGKPVEFGYKAQIAGNEIIVDHNLEQGNPVDGPQLAPAVHRVIRRTGRKPRIVIADRRYGEQAIEDALKGLGVRHVVIPGKGKPGKARQAAERRPEHPDRVRSPARRKRPPRRRRPAPTHPQAVPHEPRRARVRAATRDHNPRPATTQPIITTQPPLPVTP
jgi:IS5 family transposase